jgi:hypothetical protein
MQADIWQRGNSVEECYEFMLAYAAQGLRSDEDSPRVREFLQRAVNALRGLASCFATAVQQADLEPMERYLAFLDVLHRDAEDSAATIELVVVQHAISSQLIDNLNACIHLRALLTDLFLFAEIPRAQPTLAATTTRKASWSIQGYEPRFSRIEARWMDPILSGTARRATTRGF